MGIKKFKFIVVFLFSCISFAQAQDISIPELRKNLRDGQENKEIAEKTHQILEKMDSTNPRFNALKASNYGVMCIHHKSPIKRMNYLKQMSAIIDEAVEQAPNDLEIRLIRLSIETQVPKFLGFSKNIKKDRDFVKANFKKANFSDSPYEALEAMIHLMDESKEFTVSDITKMKAELEKYEETK